jgi:arylsulfatase A-like enzyme
MSSLLTGLYPSFIGVKKWSPYSYHGLTRFQKGDEKAGLPSGVQTLAEWMRLKDYVPVGLNTNPYMIKKFGYGRGYEIYEDFYEEGKNLESDSFYPKAELVLKHGADLGLRFSKERFFLWIHIMDAHIPWNPPLMFYPNREELKHINQGFVNLFKDQEELGKVHGFSCRNRITLFDLAGQNLPKLKLFLDQCHKVYEASIRYIDEELWKFFTTLDSIGLLDRSLIILTSDHGEEFGEYGFLGHHNLGGASPVLVNTPLVLRFPRAWNISANVSPYQSSGVDIVPTILDLLGQEWDFLDGESLIPVVTGQVQQRPVPVHINLSNGAHFIYKDGYKYINYPKESFELIYKEDGLYKETVIQSPSPQVIEEFRRHYEDFVSSYGVSEGYREISTHEVYDDEIKRRLAGLGYL